MLGCHGYHVTAGFFVCFCSVGRPQSSTGVCPLEYVGEKPYYCLMWWVGALSGL